PGGPAEDQRDALVRCHLAGGMGSAAELFRRGPEVRGARSLDRLELSPALQPLEADRQQQPFSHSARLAFFQPGVAGSGPLPKAAGERLASHLRSWRAVAGDLCGPAAFSRHGLSGGELGLRREHEGIPPHAIRLHGDAANPQEGLPPTLAGRRRHLAVASRSSSPLSNRRFQNHAQRRADAIPPRLFPRPSRSPPRPRPAPSLIHRAGHRRRGRPVWHARLPSDRRLGARSGAEGARALRLSSRKRSLRCAERVDHPQRADPRRPRAVGLRLTRLESSLRRGRRKSGPGRQNHVQCPRCGGSPNACDERRRSPDPDLLHPKKVGALPVEGREEVKRTNEIKTAIPLLETIDIAGKDITVDALLTQRKFAEYLVEQRQAHYYFTVKGNQPGLLADLQFYFQDRGQPHFVEHTPPDHGRLETRKIWTTAELNDYLDFPYVGQAFLIERHVTNKKTGEYSLEIAYGLTSRLPAQANPQRVLQVNRGHWVVENSCHYVLDWNFDEDRSRIRTGYGPENITRLRRFAIGVIKARGARSVAQKMRQLTRNVRLVFDYLRMTKNSCV